MSPSVMIYIVAMQMTKLSICFPRSRAIGVHPICRRLVNGGMIFCILHYSATPGFEIAKLILCNPPSLLERRFCVDKEHMTTTQAILQNLTDVYLFLLPIVTGTLLGSHRPRKDVISPIVRSGFM